MSSATAIARHPARCLLAGLAVALAACGTTSQKMDLSPDLIATPPHRMARSEYPFDASGRYVDAWAAEGAGRFGRAINTDRTEDGRSDVTQPERRPLPPPRPVATAQPPPDTRSSTNRRPTTAQPPQPPTPKPAASKPTASKPTASKPPAKKPPAKKKPSTHTVKRGDSLSSLSSRYGVSVSALKKANNLKSDRIIDGRKLVIPKN